MIPRFTAALLPELILSVGGTILMLVAAFAGRRGSGVTSWLAVLLLLVATAALVGAPSHSGPLFDGFISADLFASFGKALMFPAAAVAIIAGHGWFESDHEHSSEYAVLIVFAAVATSRSRTASQLVTAEPRRPTKAATSIRIVPPTDRISSGSKAAVKRGINALLPCPCSSRPCRA